MKVSWKLYVFIAAIIVLIAAVVYRFSMSEELSYNGWNRYSNEEAGYEIRIPAGYTVYGENSIPGFTGQQLDTGKTQQISANRYSLFSIYHQAWQKEPPSNQELEALARQILSADLSDFELEPADTSSEVLQHYTFNGTTKADSLSTTGSVEFILNEGFLIVIEQMLPDQKKDLEPTWEKIRASFSLVEEK